MQGVLEAYLFCFENVLRKRIRGWDLNHGPLTLQSNAIFIRPRRLSLRLQLCFSVLNVLEPAPDPIMGRYHLVSSEGFDEFLKALGVGMIKRKLASSVSPIIIVDVDRNGKTVVRVWVFWIRCSFPFQARQLGRDFTLSVRCKTQRIDNKVSERGCYFALSQVDGEHKPLPFFGVHRVIRPYQAVPRPDQVLGWKN